MCILAINPNRLVINYFVEVFSQTVQEIPC